MCFDHDAHPPDLPADVPRAAGGAAAEIAEAVSADGTRLSVGLALAPEPCDTAVAIIPDVRGLYRFYLDLAERFAAAGHHAVAIDPFGRTAGTGEREGDWDCWPHVRQTTPAGVQADLAAGVALLRTRAAARRVVLVGFCFGGGQAFLAATEPGLPIDGAVGFYGVLDGARLGLPSPRDLADRTRIPVLALFGGDDPAIPASDRDVFAAGLARSGARHEVVVYPGAPHSFFDRRQDEHAEASADAWRRMLAFVREVGAGA